MTRNDAGTRMPHSWRRSPSHHCNGLAPLSCADRITQILPTLADREVGREEPLSAPPPQ